MSIFEDLDEKDEQEQQEQQETQAKAPEPPQELEEIKRKVAELEEAKKRLEQLLQEPPKPPQQQPSEDPSLGLFQEVAVLKLERYLASDPVAQKYRDEVVRVLQQLPDPKARATDAAIEAAIKYVKGAHLEEIVKQTAPPPPPPPSEAAAKEPERRAPVVELNDQQKSVAAMWFGGDLELVKRNILGLED